MSEIISRKDALAQGLKFYFTGEPCKHDHLVERYVSGRNCCECYKGTRISEMRARNYLENKEAILKRTNGDKARHRAARKAAATNK